MNSKLENQLKTTQVERSIFLECFRRYPEVLAWILNDCGRWAQFPEKVSPELLAFTNRLLGKIGSIHEANLVTIAKGYLEMSNDNDLALIRAQEEAEEKTQEEA